MPVAYTNRPHPAVVCSLPYLETDSQLRQAILPVATSMPASTGGSSSASTTSREPPLPFVRLCADPRKAECRHVALCCATLTAVTQCPYPCVTTHPPTRIGLTLPAS